jgi:hypothetical protein
LPRRRDREDVLAIALDAHTLDSAAPDRPATTRVARTRALPQLNAHQAAPDSVPPDATPRPRRRDTALRYPYGPRREAARTNTPLHSPGRSTRAHVRARCSDPCEAVVRGPLLLVRGDSEWVPGWHCCVCLDPVVRAAWWTAAGSPQHQRWRRPLTLRRRRRRCRGCTAGVGRPASREWPVARGSTQSACGFSSR